VVHSRFEHAAAVTGLGQSTVGRRLGRSALDLTVQACRAAIADAGLRPQDVDGLSTYPGGDAAASFGYGGPPTYDVQDALRLNVDWYQGAAELPGQLGAIVAACMAVATGMARHVLVYRTVTESTARGTAGRGSVLGTDAAVATGMGKWMAPLGGISAANWLAPVAMGHFFDYGTTREQLAQIPIAVRRHAALNPQAVLRSPLTLDDYLGARMISSPLCLFDCDIPVDGSTALIVSNRDTAKDCQHDGVYVEAIGTALRGRPSWDRYHDIASMASQGAADQLWQRSALRPSDVDVAQLYATDSAFWRWCGWNRWGSAVGVKEVRSWRTAAASRWAVSYRSTPRGDSSRPAVCTDMAPFTTLSPSCAGRQPTVRWPGPKSHWFPTAAARSRVR
jgi:acetyl-CoA acetyltransferase